MRIILIQNDLPPDHFGGSEVLTLELAKNFSNRGFKTFLITRKLPHQNSAGEINGIPVIRVGIPFKKNSKKFPYKFLWFISYIVFGCVICLKLRPDIIHSHTRVPGGVISGICGFLMKIPSFLTIHVNLDVIGSSEKVMTKLVLKINKCIVVQTKFSKHQVKNQCSSKIFIIPNGIRLSDKDRYFTRSRFGNEILFVGRLHAEKGLEHAIKSCRILKNKNIFMRLYIVGEGQENYNLMDLTRKLGLKKSVVFFGKVSNRKKKELFRKASYFLLPSLSECFPVTILEAMREKLFIIATSVGGVPEMLEGGKFGVLVMPRDEVALANTIENIFKLNEEEKRKIVDKAQIFVQKKYSINTVSFKHVQCYSFRKKE